MNNRSANLQYAKVAMQAASDKLGENVVALDVRGQTAVTEVFVFVGATSHLHVRALEDAVRDELREAGAELIRTDGQRGHVWRALDYGGLIVHIMDSKTREFYALERLWEGGKRLPFKDTAAPAAPAAPAAKKKSRTAKPVTPKKSRAVKPAAKKKTRPAARRKTRK